MDGMGWDGMGFLGELLTPYYYYYYYYCMGGISVGVGGDGRWGS
jgi:hypothetical protein